jgi:peroxiredoxin
VYREERSGVAGLKRIKAGSMTTFTLAVDLNKESSGAYSAKKSDFSNYVIDKAGKIQKIVPGTKTTRATADQLLKTLKELQKSS